MVSPMRMGKWASELDVAVFANAFAASTSMSSRRKRGSTPDSCAGSSLAPAGARSPVGRHVGAFHARPFPRTPSARGFSTHHQLHDVELEGRSRGGNIQQRNGSIANRLISETHEMQRVDKSV